MAVTFLDSITVDGNVGIGTTSPTEKLHVKTSGVEIAKYETTATADLAIELANSQGSMFFGLGGGEQFGVGTTSDLNGTGNLFIIEQGGNTGIGTTSPAKKLDVNGDVTFGTGNKFQTITNALEGVGANGVYLRSAISSAANPSFSNSDDTNTGMFLPGSDVLGLSTAGSERMRITSAGDVGIGTSSPSDKLTVAGDIVTTAGTDGGMRIGGWPYNTTGYSFIGTTNMTGLEYCMLSDGTNTFIGAGTGGVLKLRGPANDSSPEVLIDGSVIEVNTGDMKIPDGSLAVGNISNSATDGRIDASNDVVAFSTSDIRLKDNIKSIDKALDKVNSIQGIEFDWKEFERIHGNKGHDVGVIAQEVEKVIPEVVTTRDNGYKAVKYEKIVPLLIEAIKDLSKQVDGLKRLI